tara:strand:- start:1829 stop:2086 length:258 start_codon:yes stop_codon:yes gene_type:complete
MYRIFGIMCIVGLTGSVDCTTQYRTDLQTYETEALCEAAQPAIMEETLRSFEILSIDFKSVQLGCEKITAEKYEQWKKNQQDDVI